MKAAWYEKQGAARDVLIVGEMDEPQPLAGEVRIRLAASSINPGDVKKRQNAFGVGMPFPHIIPHSDGAGTVDAVGEGVSAEWIGRRVWCYGAQTYRPFGTAAEYTVVPLRQAVPLPETVPLKQGACLGIPGITAHRAVHVAGLVEGRIVLVQGGAGAVGACAVQFAHRAGARVIATRRSENDKEIASRAGADEVLLTHERLAERIKGLAPAGVDHMVMTPRIGEDFVRWKPPTGGDSTLGIVDFSIFPHLDHELLPENTMADAERWAGEIAGPAYAIDDETAIRVTDGTVDVISEGHWKLFTP